MFENADLIAPDGFVYTNGSDVFAKKIWLGEGMSEDRFSLISEEEHRRLTEAEELNCM